MAFKKLINSKTILSFFAAFMLFGTNLLMAQTPAAAAGTGEDANQVDWTGVAYYVLIFFLICLGVAVIGKILKIYDLTLKIQGRKGLKWNNVMGAICLIFLIAGLYGAYWSFTVQGSMTLPEAASRLLLF
jgi:cytochrome c oxidase subunit 2